MVHPMVITRVIAAAAPGPAGPRGTASRPARPAAAARSNVKIKRFIIVKYGEIADWDVSNVTDMEEMFYFEGGEFFISGSAV